jgi:glycosyltransferase involved in cell wall biosynthesis
VAFVGSVSPLKGGRLIEPVVRDLHERDPTIPIHVLGGGDAALLLGLRTLSNVTVHGYYRAGSLPAHLARLGVEVAVAPSIVPEAFQLTISECWLAGVPVVAFDHGAAAERIPAHGGGIAVPLGAGAAGLALAIEELRSGAVPCDLADAAASVPSSAAAAAALRQLYAELGLASAGST